ncbi:MAG: hypothetical protein ACI9HH_004809 [Pseudomonadota bacterium]|jgi:hypothetical protein
MIAAPRSAAKRTCLLADHATRAFDGCCADKAPVALVDAGRRTAGRIQLNGSPHGVLVYSSPIWMRNERAAQFRTVAPEPFDPATRGVKAAINSCVFTAGE